MNNIQTPINDFSPCAGFPALLAKFRNNHSWKEIELKSVILLKSPAKNILLTALNQGCEVTSFHQSNTISFNIIEGCLKFKSSKNAVTLNSGELLELNGKISYKLTASENTVFVTTISRDPFRTMVN
ncbi:MAG: hypothetical protein HC905_01775 [Bacteroidales bacterium]|nr:hypothetical protein [Bacteroidales bacterium]